MIFLVQLLWMWVYGVLSVVVILLALALLYGVFRRPKRRVFIRKPGNRRDEADRGVAVGSADQDLRPAVRNAVIAIAVLLLSWSVFGRHLALMFRPGDASAPGAMIPASTQTIARPDGTQLYVESQGPASGPTLILTHGWSLDTRVWDYAKRDLSDRFHVITWDLPGLGRSTEPANRDYSLEKMAADLGAVIETTGKPAVLVGHSIGGMINLTYCRLHPEQLGREVAGIVQLDTTYTDPVKTTSSSGFDTAMQKPVYEPLMHLTIFASPLVRAMNWLSYHNGLAHIMTASSSFAGAETREQLDYAARRNYEASPAVLARGMLGMFHWDATPVLPGVRVQTLILEGEQDKTTAPPASRYMRDSMPAAELQMVNQAAHLGLLEQNRIYDEAIRRFADTCFGGSRRALNTIPGPAMR